MKTKFEGDMDNFIQFIKDKYEDYKNRKRCQINHIIHSMLHGKIINVNHTTDIIESRPSPHSITRVNDFSFATPGIYSEKIRG